MPGAQPNATSSPAASGRTNRRPVGAARPETDGGAPVVILVLLALITVGGTVTFLGISRRREREPIAAAAPLPPMALERAPVVPALWHGRSGRFSRAVTKTTATVPATQERGGEGPRGGGGAPRRKGAPALAASASSTAKQAGAGAPAGAPPDRRRAWTAEIEWREIEGESRFCVIARGAGTVEVAQSPPLEWPPEGPAAVQAMRDAADKLAATLVAAGWKALPPGRAWYAKRFAWKPPLAEPAKGAKGPTGPKTSPSKSTGAKPVASPRLATRVPASGESGASDRVRSRRSRAKQVALLGVLAVVGLIAALQFGDGGDDAPAGKPQESIDLSVPLLVLLSVVFLVMVIREIRSRPG